MQGNAPQNILAIPNYYPVEALATSEIVGESDLSDHDIVKIPRAM